MGAACSSGDVPHPASKKERKSKKEKPISPSMTPTTSNLKKGKQTSPSMTPTTSNLKKGKQTKRDKVSPKNSPTLEPARQQGSPLAAHPLLPPSQHHQEQLQSSPPQIVVEKGDQGVDIKLNDDSFSDDEGPRRCSMRDNTTLKQASEALQLKAAQQLLNSQSNNKQPVHPHSRLGVKKHSAENDLWIIVRGKIFDVTSFVADHPGGSWALVNLGGSDGSKEFLSNHSDEQSAWRMLMRYYVADVQE